LGGGGQRGPPRADTPKKVVPPPRYRAAPRTRCAACSPCPRSFRDKSHGLDAPSPQLKTGEAGYPAEVDRSRRCELSVRPIVVRRILFALVFRDTETDPGEQTACEREERERERAGTRRSVSGRAEAEAGGRRRRPIPAARTLSTVQPPTCAARHHLRPPISTSRRDLTDDGWRPSSSPPFAAWGARARARTREHKRT
jgi:hypothetical protein